MTEQIDFDPEKDAVDREKHGLGLDEFPDFDAAPLLRIDHRADYGETRWTAIGRIAGQGHVVTFTRRDGRVRMISFRRAHEKEMRRHDR